MADHPLAGYAEILADLHALWKPHTVQIPPGKALFNDGCKFIFLRFGRQTGKSELISYMAVRWALTRPGSRIAIICPSLKQCRSLYLHSRKIETKIPRKYVDNIHRTDARFTFLNGSTIELFGVDEPDSLRGPTFHCVFVDELKDLQEGAMDAVITPTTAVHKAPIVLAGTPPEIAEHPYWELVKEYETNSDSNRIFTATTYHTPYIEKEWVDKQREKYKARGEDDVFRREFLAEFVPGQKKLVYPMLTDHDHIRPYEEVMHELRKNIDRWSFYAVMDPGTASFFAVILAAVNKYDQRIRILDEVYAANMNEAAIGQIWPRVMAKQKEIYEEDPGEFAWSVHYDEAATYVAAELIDRYGVAAIPTRKFENKKGAGISAVRDVLIAQAQGKNGLVATDRCVEWKRQMQLYSNNELGVPIKKDDHFPDTTRYLLSAANYTVEETAPPASSRAELQPGQLDEPKRMYSIADDLKAMGHVDMWADEYGDSFVDDEPDLY